MGKCIQKIGYLRGAHLHFESATRGALSESAFRAGFLKNRQGEFADTAPQFARALGANRGLYETRRAS